VNKGEKVVVVVFLVFVGLVVLGVILSELRKPQVAEVPRGCLRLKITEGNDEYDEGDILYIVFHKNNKYVLYYEDDDEEGTYEYKELDGMPYLLTLEAETTLDFDDNSDWSITFQKDNKFQEGGDQDVKGEFKWKSRGSLKTSNLVLTMEFDDYPKGYNEGNKAYITFEGDIFYLDDKFGDFDGEYEYVEDEILFLDFYGYPPWYIEFNDESGFSGVEHGYDNGGIYKWT
jgi:hypothetical protein